MVRCFSLTIKGTQYQNDIDKFNKVYDAQAYEHLFWTIPKLMGSIEIASGYTLEKDSKGRLHMHGLLYHFDKITDRLPNIVRNLKRNKYPLRFHIKVDLLCTELDKHKWLQYINKNNYKDWQYHNKIVRSLSNTTAPQDNAV